MGILLQTIGMARDRPSPYGGRDDFVGPTVARGPVPRELSTGIRVSMHGEGQALALQLKEFVHLTVARGPVPREFPTGIRVSMHGADQALALRLSGR